ncbi:MAG: hypothetical protein ACRDGM_11210, partial [bacterium]
VWPDIGPGKVTSTFNLYRLIETSVTDLGIPKTDWQSVVLGQPCMFIGAWSDVHERFFVKDQGSLTKEMIILWTSYEGIKEGDDLYLAFDGIHYHVQDTSYEGRLRRCLCDSSQNQNISP